MALGTLEELWLIGVKVEGQVQRIRWHYARRMPKVCIVTGLSMYGLDRIHERKNGRTVTDRA